MTAPALPPALEAVFPGLGDLLAQLGNLPEPTPDPRLGQALELLAEINTRVTAIDHRLASLERQVDHARAALANVRLPGLGALFR